MTCYTIASWHCKYTRQLTSHSLLLRLANRTPSHFYSSSQSLYQLYKDRTVIPNQQYDTQASVRKSPHSSSHPVPSNTPSKPPSLTVGNSLIFPCSSNSCAKTQYFTDLPIPLSSQEHPHPQTSALCQCRYTPSYNLIPHHHEANSPQSQ
jgi:hypothetical protein